MLLLLIRNFRALCTSSMDKVRLITKAGMLPFIRSAIWREYLYWSVQYVQALKQIGTCFNPLQCGLAPAECSGIVRFWSPWWLLYLSAHLSSQQLHRHHSKLECVRISVHKQAIKHCIFSNESVGTVVIVGVEKWIMIHDNRVGNLYYLFLNRLCTYTRKLIFPLVLLRNFKQQNRECLISST